MFKFNFSSDIPSADDEEKGEKEDVLEWEDSKEIEWDISELIDEVQLASTEATCREFEYGDVRLLLVQRNQALNSIAEDVNSPRFALEAEENNSDLEPAKYEGGLKVWECTEDLGEYMEKELGERELTGKDVLDLGCGAGLIGILALKLGANAVTFQDYNVEVLQHWTQRNVALNLPATTCSSTTCKFWSGDWGSFADICKEKYDFIFTSETIYNTDNYRKLCKVLLNMTKPTATIFLAAKSVYFSLGGSVQLFLSQLSKESNDTCDYKYVFKSDQGVHRVIVEIKRKDHQTAEV